MIGREREQATLAAFVREGAGALVLEGPAGIGKSTLFDAALAGANRVLRCRPAAAETQLAFSGLTDLLGDEPLPPLPVPQREALEAALLLRPAAAAPDVRAIAAGLLGVLRACAPLIVAIDDVQWLDPPSRAVLTFALRRSQGIGVLVARRGAGDLPFGLTGQRLVVEPMSPEDLHRLVYERLGVSLSRPVLRRVHAASGGNPFYALEIARRAPARDQPLPVEHLLDERLDALPDDVIALLQRVVLLYDRRLAVVREVALGDGLLDALDAAVSAGVLELVGDRVRVSHGLLSSAIDGRIGPARRVALHQRLAAVETSGEARALHLALSHDRPDAAVADEIAAAADAAAGRGAADTAGRLAEHAARLTPPERVALAAHRLTSAAEHHVTAGDVEHARALLTELVARLDPGPLRALALSLLSADPPSGDLAEAIALGCQALDEAEGDLRIIAATRQRLSATERIRGNLAASAEHGRLAVDAAREVGDARTLALALASLGQTEFVRGAGLGGELHAAVELERELPGFLGQHSPSRRLGLALVAADDLDEARSLFTELLERATTSGHEDARAMALSHLADLERRAGLWDRALEAARESEQLAHQASTAQEHNAIRAIGTMLRVGLGDPGAHEAALDGLRVAEQIGDFIFVIQLRGALGTLELSRGEHAAAAEWLRPATDLLIAGDVVELGVCPDVVHNEVEALVALGELDRSAQLVDWLEQRAALTGRAWIRGVALRSRALLLMARGELGEARAAAQAAAIALKAAGQPLEHARALVCVGSLERRAKQWRASQAALDQAITIFDGLPAPQWAQRARDELARGGRVQSGSELTPTETRIAQLAAEGRSNPEIAAAVYVSRKTVEANLSKIYRKLGVRSRVELTRRLMDER